MKRTRRNVWTGVLVMALALVSGSGSLVRASDGKDNGNNNNGGGNNTEVRLRTQLAGGAINGRRPSGNADFRMDSSPSRTKLNVEVEDVNLPARAVLQVSVMHAGAVAMVGTIKLSAFGGGEVELDSRDGDAVPALVKGDSVTVSNAGAAILIGAF